MRKVLIGTLLPLLLLVGACGADGAHAPQAVESNTLAPAAPTGGSSGTTPANGSDGSGGTIDWKPVRTLDGVEEGTLKVPIDDKDPSQGEFTLYMERHLAAKPKERIGTLLVNPGGPGFPGSPLAEQAASIYGPDLVDRFDILGWDPRGTGRSTPAIDCFSNYDHFFDSADITPDTPQERQQNIDLAKELTNDCVSKNQKILDHVGTNESARDIDAIRRALGEDKISFFGFSYGSELGAAWATLFPDTVRAAVLDGAVDPTADPVQQNLQQNKGLETALDTFLQQCSQDSNCAFRNGGQAGAAFDALMSSIDQHPLPAEEGRPPLTLGAALSGVAQAMYSSSLWPVLASALADAQRGDGSALMQLYDDYFQRQPDGSYDNTLEAFTVILCMDEPSRQTVAEEDADAAKFTAVAPRLSPPGSTGGYQCTFFPPSTDPRVAITGKGAGPILVVGTTGDPITPLDGTRNMAAALEQGVLLVVDGEQHTGYGVNECSRTTVDAYLVDPVQHVPANGTECK